MSEYTKGPWKEDGTEYCHRLSHGVVNGDEDVVIAHCDSENLSLIAAAPELLEELVAVQDLLSMLACMDHATEVEQKLYSRLNSVEALIAKAKGES